MTILDEIMEANAVSQEDMTPEKSLREKLQELQAQNQMLTECLMELSEIVYA